MNPKTAKPTILIAVIRDLQVSDSNGIGKTHAWVRAREIASVTGDENTALRFGADEHNRIGPLEAQRWQQERVCYL